MTTLFRQVSLSLLTASLGLALNACAAGASGPHVELNGKRFDVEIAEDDASRERGLMFRDSMPKEHGMIFLFPRAENQAFWMKNTRLPLDIFYFDANWHLVNVHKRVPPCQFDPCPAYPSTGAAQYVLELNAGLADELAIKPGATLKFQR